VDELLDRAATTGAGSVAVLLVAVDDPGTADGTAGPGADALVVKVARHLSGALDGRGTLARMAGLRFAIVDHVADEPAAAAADAEHLARRIVRSFVVPFPLPDGAAYLSCRVGVSTAHAASASGALLREAVAALDGTTQDASGVGRVVVWAPTLQAERLARTRAADALRDAVATGDLALLVEPVLGLADGELRGARALTVWQHPEHGPVGPDGYRALAEACGLAVPIWAMTLRAACGLAHRWGREDGGAPVPVTVELPPRVVTEPGCVAEVAAALGQWPLDPSRLVLELTDAAALAESAATRATVQELRELGVTIAARGFGGRCAPAAAVRDLAVSVVSLDPALTRDRSGDLVGRAVLGSVVQLARALAVDVHAVDVATPADAEELRTAGIDAGSGPRWAAPMGPADFAAWTPGPVA
jgi:EAL domain-containing protein (putative c-di-GMP-specific phosphodiesterase class I)/GGDEF domain-containing protein